MAFSTCLNYFYSLSVYSFFLFFDFVFCFFFTVSQIWSNLTSWTSVTLFQLISELEIVSFSYIILIWLVNGSSISRRQRKAAPHIFSKKKKTRRKVAPHTMERKKAAPNGGRGKKRQKTSETHQTRFVKPLELKGNSGPVSSFFCPSHISTRACF